jgi:hypothetical protein
MRIAAFRNGNSKIPSVKSVKSVVKKPRSIRGQGHFGADGVHRFDDLVEFVLP